MPLADTSTDDDTFFCAECGEPYVENIDGTTQHVDVDGDVDHDADEDHVPYA